MNLNNCIIFDTETNERYDVATLPQPKQFQSPSHYKHWGCDLHPRWDRESTKICFDATFSGVRSLCTIDLGNDLQFGNLKFVKKSAET